MPLLTACGSGGDCMKGRPTSVPARILFAPKEMRHYSRWQRQILHLKNHQLGKIPTATQYDVYLRWREAQKQQDTDLFGACRLMSELGEHLNPAQEERDDRLTASTCKHALHPASTPPGRLVELCPCCVIHAHIRYMKLLTDTLDHQDADPGCWVSQSGTDYQLALDAWRYGKLDVAQTMQELHEVASAEAEWEREHPDATTRGDIMTSARAVEMYQASVDPDANLSDDTRCESGYLFLPTPLLKQDSATAEGFLPSALKCAGPGCADPPECAQKECAQKDKCAKSVSFTDGTNFEYGRPQIYFRKSSPRYEPRPQSPDDAVVDNADPNANAHTAEDVQDDETKKTVAASSEPATAAANADLPLTFPDSDDCAIEFTPSDSDASDSDEEAASDTADNSDEEPVTDDGDSDWETESDSDEGSDDDSDDEGGFIAFEDEDDGSFVMFGY